MSTGRRDLRIRELNLEVFIADVGDQARLLGSQNPFVDKSNLFTNLRATKAAFETNGTHEP